MKTLTLKSYANGKNLKRIKRECQNFVNKSKHDLSDICRCGLGKQIFTVMDHLFALEQMISENATLIAFKSSLTNELKEGVSKGRQDLKKMKVCAHESNDLNIIF